MITDFERCKEKIGARTIMLTSWFDDARQTWRASAPAYAYLSIIVGTERIHCDSRKAAIAHLQSVLNTYFASLDGTAETPVAENV